MKKKIRRKPCRLPWGWLCTAEPGRGPQGQLVIRRETELRLGSWPINRLRSESPNKTRQLKRALGGIGGLNAEHKQAPGWPDIPGCQMGKGAGGPAHCPQLKGQFRAA